MWDLRCSVDFRIFTQFVLLENIRSIPNQRTFLFNMEFYTSLLRAICSPPQHWRMHLVHLHERGKSFAEYSSKISLSVTKMGALLQASTAGCCRCVFNERFLEFEGRCAFLHTCCDIAFLIEVSQDTLLTTRVTRVNGLKKICRVTSKNALHKASRPLKHFPIRRAPASIFSPHIHFWL